MYSFLKDHISSNWIKEVEAILQLDLILKLFSTLNDFMILFSLQLSQNKKKSIEEMMKSW